MGAMLLLRAHSQRIYSVRVRVRVRLGLTRALNSLAFRYIYLLKINGYFDNGLDIGVASTCMLVSFCPLGQSLHVLPFW